MINKIESDLNQNKEQFDKMNIISELLKLQNNVNTSRESNVDKTKETNLKKEFKEIIDQILANLDNKSKKEIDITALNKQMTLLRLWNIEDFIDTYKVQVWKNRSEQHVLDTIAEAKNDTNPIARWIWIIMDKIWS